MTNMDRSSWWERWRPSPTMAVLWAVVLVLLAVVFLRAGWPAPPPPDAVGWSHDLRQAFALARERKVPLLVNFTADWCPPCQLMHREVYSDPAVGDLIQDRFVPLEVDMTQPGQEQVAMARLYGIDGWPTLLVLQPDGRPLAAIPGYMPKEALMPWLAGYDLPDAATQRAGTLDSPESAG